MKIITKNSWVHYSIFVFMLGAILFTSCSKNERIEGKVQDVFGNSLSDVTVKIEKSTFSAKTDGSGQYSLDYVPGSINLTFSKNGYTTRNLSLDIQQKAYFPTETMVLYPIPAEEGFFYIDVDGRKLVKLDKNSNTKERKRQNKGFSMTQNYSYFIQVPKKALTIKSGKSMFIDKVPYLIMLTTINKDGLIYEGNLNAFERHDKYSGFLKDKSESIGKEKLLVRTADLSPGLYSWVQMDKGQMIGATPKKNGSALTFKVEGAEAK